MNGHNTPQSNRPKSKIYYYNYSNPQLFLLYIIFAVRYIVVSKDALSQPTSE